MIHLLMVSVLLGAGADESTRKMTPVAPSLPALTKEEEKKQDAIIDRMILADTGRLRGEEARKAMKEFDKLGMEATPALIRGLNQVAKLNHSCPILVISKKLVRLLDSTNDPQLLEYARDEIGGGVRNSPHGRVLQDLRVRCMLRKNALARLRPVAPALGTLSKMKDVDLVKAAGSTRGLSLRGILRELSTRDSKEALEGLTRAAASNDRNARSYGRDMLDVYVARLPLSSLKEKLGDDHVEVRLSAVRVAGRESTNAAILIERLADESAAVRAEARAALKKLSKTEDFGPEADANKSQQREAQRKWKAWFGQVTR